MPDYVIEAHGLRKAYGDVVAVDQVDLVVERGRVYGALGPNGSGKSTTVRMLLGLARPDKGEVKLFGKPLKEDSSSLLKRVGAVVETPAFVPYLSGRDNLRLLAKYTPGPTSSTIEAVLERVNLSEAAHRRFKNYSLGMKQRLGIAAAILNDPELIVLDEPTNGLDPQGTREVRALIPELAAEGRTIVLCSHLLYEVEQVCDAITIFQKGRVVAQGPTKELIGTRTRLEIRVPDIDASEALLRGSQWAESISRLDGALLIEGAGDQGEAVNRLLAAGGQYASVLRPIRASLEDVFFELTGDPAHA
ncbi:MAG: ABC transporter ATP-binding protein [Anaerolineaceae bacterium]